MACRGEKNLHETVLKRVRGGGQVISGRKMECFKRDWYSELLKETKLFPVLPSAFATELGK
jgi:hypothetical protein